MSEVGMGLIWLGFLWLMAVLFDEYGPIVIFLFLSLIGNILLAVMTLIKIERTWKPLGLVLLGGWLNSVL